MAPLVGVLLAALLASAPSSAQADDALRAAELFEEGRRLADSADTLDEACEKLSLSYALVRAGHTLLNLALCHRSQGKMATAFREFGAALELAEVAQFEEAASVARKARDEVEHELSYLTIDVPRAVVQLENVGVAVNGEPLPRAQWGRARAVDPATYHIKVVAHGFVPWERRVTISAEPKQTRVDVELIRLTSLTIAMPKSIGVGVRLWVDDEEVPRASWGLAVAVTPGQHRIHATAPSRVPATYDVVVESGDSKSIVVELPAAPSPVRRRWYGWQNLMLHGSAHLGVGAGAIVGVVASPLTGLVMAFFGASIGAIGNPIVHWAHGNAGAGFASLGFNVALPVANASAICAVGCENLATELIAGGVLGMASATVLDVAWLAYDDVAAEEESDAQLWWRPHLTLDRESWQVGAFGRF